MLRGSKFCASPPDSRENVDDMEDMEPYSLAGQTRENKNIVEGEKANALFSRKKVTCVKKDEAHLCGHGLFIFCGGVPAM